MVEFPGLGLKFNINRVAISILGIKIYWYAILIVIGIVLALIILKKNSKLVNVEYSKFLDLFLYLIPISIIGARIYYVIFNFEIYSENIWDIFNIRKGGLAIYGGIIAGCITIIVYCKKNKIDILKVLDSIAPCLALGQAIGRWGNFINIEAYGTETKNFLRMGIFENGVYKQVHPCFLYESIADFIIFLVLMCLGNKRQKNGERTIIYLFMYSFARFFIEGLRIDSLMFGNIRISQALSLSIFVIICCIISYNKLKTNKTKKIEKKWHTKMP